MGLDIRVFQHAHRTPEHERTDDCYDANHVEAYILTGFERSLRGLIEGRCYLTSGRQLHFRAGSYGGYNRWRRELCSIALEAEPSEIWEAPDEWADQPFFELIHFADNEGTIGPEACADLAEDFRAHREAVRPQLAAMGPDFGQLYDEWQEAFELAAGSGLVDFA